MFTLLRLVFWLFIAALVVWFSATVPLGTRTLWGHLRAIGGTKEAKELAEGTKAEAKKVAELLFERRDGGAPDLAPHDRPMENLSAEDQRALDKLTKKKAKK